jgi:hypothetical protein
MARHFATATLHDVEHPIYVRDDGSLICDWPDGDLTDLSADDSDSDERIARAFLNEAFCVVREMDHSLVSPYGLESAVSALWAEVVITRVETP